MESANKLLVEERLKGSGMHWARHHVTPMLALRTLAFNDRWDEAWPQIVARLRTQRAEAGRGRRGGAALKRGGSGHRRSKLGRQRLRQRPGRRTP